MSHTNTIECYIARAIPANPTLRTTSYILYTDLDNLSHLAVIGAPRSNIELLIEEQYSLLRAAYNRIGLSTKTKYRFITVNTANGTASFMLEDISPQEEEQVRIALFRLSRLKPINPQP